jgi:sigma-B regulation protein RsbU (phosphoserine phosphatase)
MLLRTPGLVVGSMPGVHYATAQCDIPPGSKLFVLSDGTYEITLADGSMLSFEQFVEHLALPADPQQSDFHRLLAYVQGLQGQPHFADDFSIMRLVF